MTSLPQTDAAVIQTLRDLVDRLSARLGELIAIRELNALQATQKDSEIERLTRLVESLQGNSTMTDSPSEAVHTLTDNESKNEKGSE